MKIMLCVFILGALQKCRAQSRAASDLITANQLKEYLDVIASDEMRGRDTPSPGLDSSARFIASKLKEWGVTTGGDSGSYFQRIPLLTYRVNSKNSFVSLNGRRFEYGDFLNAFPFLPQGRREAVVTGKMVYVQHGLIVKAKGIDPYQRQDVKDKILICSGAWPYPNNVTYEDFTGRRGMDFDFPWSYAYEHGARGVIFVPSFYRLANWDTFRKESLEKGITSYVEIDTTRPFAMANASPKLLDALFDGEPSSGEMILGRTYSQNYGESFTLNEDKEVKISIGFDSTNILTQNVIGIIEGSDPRLKKEYVALGAHYDHVGTSIPIDGDSIYNGADDDGSGTVALLSLAHAFSKGPRPRRSILFIWHCGEEKGLWGSAHFVNHPKVDLDKIVVQLNIDMIGRSKQYGDSNPANKELTGPNEIYVIGSKVLSTRLGEISEEVNSSFLELKFNYKYDNPKDPNKFFARSDHFNYAKKGIPIIFYFSGEHKDYHRPSDSSDKIDYVKMERVVRTIYATAWELANTAVRPKVDKKIPEELLDFDQ